MQNKASLKGKHGNCKDSRDRTTLDKRSQRGINGRTLSPYDTGSHNGNCYRAHIWERACKVDLLQSIEISNHEPPQAPLLPPSF